MSKRLLACVLCWSSACSFADEPFPSLTIADAVSMVVANHPAVEALDAEIRAANELRRQAGTRPNPEADFGAGFKDTDADSGYEVDAALSFPVERQGKRESRIAIADSDIAAAGSALTGLRRDVELQVRTLAYEYIAAAADAEIAGEIAERSRAMIDLLKQRPAAGPVILLELRVVEGSLVEFQKSAREFAAQRDAARASLNVLLGRSPETPLDLHGDLQVPSSRYDLDELERNLESNPALLKRLAETVRAAHEATSAQLDARPDYSLGPYVSLEDAGERELTVGVAASIPLPWRNRNEGAIAAAQARREGAEAQLAADLLAARADLVRLHRLYLAAVEQAESIPANLVQSLHDAADLADRQYRLGAIPVQLFLDMQREFLSVQLLRHNALLEALRKEAELSWLAQARGGEDVP